LVAVFIDLGATDPKRSIDDPVLDSTRVNLVKASTKLSALKNGELSVSLEQFSKTASPVTRKDQQKLIEQIRNIQREINSSEAEFAGEFLSELLSKSRMQNSTMNAISEALRKAQWQRASQLARNISNVEASNLSGKERQVLDALQEHHAQVKSSKVTTDSQEPKSEALRKKLTSLAREYSPKGTASMLNTLNDVRASLAEIAQPSAADSKSKGTSSTKSNEASIPSVEKAVIGRAKTLNAKGVNPLVAAGPGQSLAAIMDLQDTGLSTLFPEPVNNKDFRDSNPVTRANVPYSRRELVKAYFHQRNSDGSIQTRNGSDD